jgi:hypothetical protein
MLSILRSNLFVHVKQTFSKESYHDRNHWSPLRSVHSHPHHRPFFFGSKEAIEIKKNPEPYIPVGRSHWGSTGMDAYSIMKARHSNRRGKMVRRYSGQKSKVHA